MSEIIKRLLLHPLVLAQLLIVSFLVNILALASPIFVMQVLQRYIAYGVTSTLITLTTGVIIAIIFEFIFRNLRHRIARSLDQENHKLKQLALYRIQSSKSVFGNIFKQQQYKRLDRKVQTIENTFSAKFFNYNFRSAI
jgi:ABC-type bacteriocin/lantibiotic exporters, contain an N-terminal double-glycine peptidase domain